MAGQAGNTASHHISPDMVKDIKEGPPTPRVAKQKSAPKPVSKAAEGPEKSSANPTQANEPSDGIASQNNSSRNGQGYSVFLKDLPWSVNIRTVEEEFKRFGTIKPGGVQVRHTKAQHFVFGFVEYETQQSMQAAIEASPIHMEEKEVCIEAKTSLRTKPVSKAAKGPKKSSAKHTQANESSGGIVSQNNSSRNGGHFQFGRGVYHGDNFRGRVGGYVGNANYRGGDNFNRWNEGEGYNCRNEGEFYNRRNEGEFYNRRNECVSPLVSGRSDGDNYSRRTRATSSREWLPPEWEWSPPISTLPEWQQEVRPRQQ